MRIGFQLGPDAQYPIIGQLVDERDAMRIPHRNARHAQRLFAQRQFDVRDRIARQGGRDLPGRKDRLTHVDPNAADL